jgi:hypothetical protein
MFGSNVIILFLICKNIFLLESVVIWALTSISSGCGGGPPDLPVGLSLAGKAGSLGQVVWTVWGVDSS